MAKKAAGPDCQSACGERCQLEEEKSRSLEKFENDRAAAESLNRSSKNGRDGKMMAEQEARIKASASRKRMSSPGRMRSLKKRRKNRSNK